MSNESMKAQKAVFLDRDGTINEDPGYLSHPDQVKLFGGVGEGLGLLRKSGYLLIVISNQSGVGRGLIKPNIMPAINARLDALLLPWNARIDDYFLCFHTPEEGCECRKPKPKLLFEAAHKHGISLSESFMIGDKLSDLSAGRTAGCGSVILVRTGAGAETAQMPQTAETASFIADSLLGAARWILRR